MARASLTFTALVALLPLASCAPEAPPLAPANPPPAAATAAPLPRAAAAPRPGEGIGSGYDRPPANVLEVMHAPPLPEPYVSPTADVILLVTWQEYPSIARVAEPFLRLAGARVEPRNHSKHDSPGGYGITPCASRFTQVRVADGAERPVELPGNACAGPPTWTADGKRYAFTNTAPDAVELWVGDVSGGAVRRVDGVRLNPMLGSTVEWMADQRTLLVKLVPDGLGAPPAAPVVPNGPSIQETLGGKGQSSTYEVRDTLKNKHDEDLFDYYAASQLALVDAATLAVLPIGTPGAYDEVSPAPDGEHLLVETVHRPYSYLTTVERFPHDVDVWDRSARLVHKVASLPLADRVPVHGVPTGPRDFAWRATEPATLTWAEALDGGDWNTKAAARDKVLLQKAPFASPPVEILRTEQRFVGFYWGETPGLAFAREFDKNRHWNRTFALDVDAPKAKPRLLWDLSSDERYKDPGRPVFRPLPNGYWVVRQEGDAIYLAGQGSSVDGDRPFLDRLDLATGQSARLFRSDRTSFEQFLAVVEPGARTFLTLRQSPKDPPNVFARSLGAPIAGAAEGEPSVASTPRPVTHVADPTPVVRSIQKKLVKYKRKDGVDLSFTLYTPPGYKDGARVPTILYAYPLDYADPSKAGQVTGSEYRFTRLYQYKLLLLAGYAIVDRASFPIVGDPKKAYDTYLDQLVMDAKAAVDKAVELGVADPDRIGITGHSHGALMTANLLAHSDLFRAGVATSGSYNKTLTPFGFQNERRSVWEAQKVYVEASTFFFADKLKLPLLLMHGDDDANPGTTPLQAEKLYEAIRGNGGTSRLVMLPHEPHWYAALESNEQYLYEMIRWFDTYVKSAPPRPRAKAVAAAR